tara:strand:+ start:373 stop:735 length:363 start_codon:yes stop_codon:yes gene_type:complete
MANLRVDAINALKPNAEWNMSDDVLDWHDTSQTEPTEKEITDKIAELESAYPMNLLRQERNYRLSLCDWTQVADSKLSDSKKAEWLTYRQALRDLTSTADPKIVDDILTNVTYPTQPSSS